MPLPDPVLEGAGHLRRAGARAHRPWPRASVGVPLCRDGEGDLITRPAFLRRFVALAMVPGFVLVASCSASGSKKKASPTRTVKSEPVMTGGQLRIGLTRVSSLDPAQARSVEQLLVDDHLFDSLTAYDPHTLDAVPAVAMSGSASPDQRQWDFTLRPVAPFANGRAITADDVKYTLERIAKKGSGSPATDELTLVSGYKAFALDGSAPGLAGVTVPAPGVVHIALDGPWGFLPVALASPMF